MHHETAAHAATSESRARDKLALTQACSALWVATLSLMTAFMQTAAPVHRHLIARKIARNLALLRAEEAVFSAECRMIFDNLAQRWSAKADQLAPEQERPREQAGLRAAIAKLH
ncbi:hypothetical protein RAMLITH_15160 [Ramlibacter sp. RBP-2]|uniref:Uncharacterized protein n=1 Tax=Ramlibacter lithotrophicus TaxID=2606681 RepID=A0A7X6DHB2_9BURK|nr:hypothetical protein [Ramlibacter lithotrophicus]NKE67162.1 hypothetical protein [Ramlibacter lithotrophicus]